MRKLFLIIFLIGCKNLFDYNGVKVIEFKRNSNLKKIYKDTLKILYPYFVNGSLYFFEKENNSDNLKFIKFDTDKKIIKTGRYKRFSVNRDGTIFAFSLDKDSLCFEVYYSQKDSSCIFYTHYSINHYPFYFSPGDSFIIFFAEGWFRKINLKNGLVKKIYPDEISYFSLDSSGFKCVYYPWSYEEEKEIRVLDIDKNTMGIIGKLKCRFIFLKGDKLFAVDFGHKLRVFDLIENKIIREVDIRPYHNSYPIEFVSISSDFNSLIFCEGNEIWMLENLNEFAK